MSNPYSADQHPDLYLAVTPPPSVASGESTAYMPTSMAPIPRPQPDLKPSDIHHMGIDPNVPYFDLNLAGKDPLPNPPYDTPQGETLNSPTFYSPNFSVPSVQPYNLTEPGIDQVAEFAPDPYGGDLLAFDRPAGLDMLAASAVPMLPDPLMPDLLLYDRPDYLDFPSSMSVDPSLPDLQSPTLTQEIHMDQRPAELAPDAMSVMHSSATYQQIPTKNYEELYMTQTGDNRARTRHIGMLDLGLDRNEGRR